MNQYSTSKRKLKKLWESLISVENSQKDKLESNKQQIQKLNDITKQQFLTTPIDLGSILTFSVVPEVISGTESAIKNIDLPLSASYSTNFDIELPEEYLPFLEFSFRIKPTPDTRVENIFKYNTSIYAGDNIEVKGGVTLVYKGVPVVARRQIFTEAELTDRGISLTHTKPVWRFLLNGAGSGATISQISWTKTVGTITTTFNTNFILGGEHEITAMTSNSFTAVGDETVNDTANPPSVTSSNVTRTKSFSDADSYTIVTVSVNGFGNDVLVTTPSGSITSKEFIEAGVWLYWDSDTINLFSTGDTGTPDGDFNEIVVVPNRAAQGQNVAVDSYNQITYTRNKVIQPSVENITQTEHTTFTEKSGKEYIKISKSTNEDEFDKFRINLTGEFLIVGKANDVLDDTQDFPVYDDVFDLQSGGYVETQDHTILSKDLFALKPQDVEVDLQASFLHPFYWKENRKFTTDEL